MNSRFSLLPWAKRALFVLLAGLVFNAAADEQRIDVVRNGVQTTLVLPVYTSQGIPYASLMDIASQISGSVDVGDARAVLRLGDKSIAAGLEDDEVQAGNASLALRHPIRSYNGDALIAIEDLVPVLRAGFGFGTPDNPPATSALSLDSVEPALESIEAAPAPDAMESVSLESIDAPLQTPLETVEPAASRPLAEPSFGSASGFLLAVDPGHGGDDSGVVGPGGLVEKDLCLAVATQLRRVLKEQYGIASVSTRENDGLATFKGRRQMLASAKATLVVSIHGGANAAQDARGLMFFAHTPAQTLSVDPKPGLAAARAVAAACEGVGGDGVPPVYEMPLLLLRDVSAPGILVELGNMKNPEDEARLADSAFQSQVVTALAAGINQLLERPAAGEVAP